MGKRETFGREFTKEEVFLVKGILKKISSGPQAPCWTGAFSPNQAFKSFLFEKEPSKVIQRIGKLKTFKWVAQMVTLGNFWNVKKEVF